MPRGGRDQLTVSEISAEIIAVLGENPAVAMGEEAIKTQIRRRTNKVLRFLDWHSACDAALAEGRIERTSKTFIRLKLK